MFLIKKSSLLQMIVAVYILALMALLVLPQFKYTYTYPQIIFFSLPFTGICMFRKRKNLREITKFFIFLLALFVQRFIYNTSGHVTQALNQCITLYLCFLPIICFIALKDKNDFAIKSVVIGIIFMLSLILINTFKQFSVNPTVARLLAHGTTEDEEINLLRQMNVGGFGFSYAVGMIAPYMLIWIKRLEGMKKMIPTVIYLIICVYSILSQYTTLTILVIVFSIYVIWLENKDVLFRTIVLLLLLIVLFNLGNILLYISRHISLEVLSSHFYDMYLSLSGQGTATNRTGLYTGCLILFLKNPILGVNLLDGSNTSIINDGHSTILGYLAMGGIVGGTIYFGLVKHVIKQIQKAIGGFHDIAVLYFMYLILGILNPNTGLEISVCIFLLVPLVELLYERRHKDYDNSKLYN